MDFAAILPPLLRIEAKVDRLLAGPEKPTLTAHEAMKLTGDRSLTALYRTCEQLGIPRVKRNCYRRADILNGLGRLALQEAEQMQRNRKAALALETVTEGRRRKVFPKQTEE